MRMGAAWTRAGHALCAALAGLMLAGCGSSSGSSGNGAVDPNADLRIGMPVPQSFDPRQAPEPAQLLIGGWPVYDRLIQVSSRAQYEPMLATKWEFSAGGKTLTLTLRHGVTFSDGTPFNADAVKANLDAYLAAGKTVVRQNLADVAGVEVAGDDVVRLRLTTPSTTVLSALSSTLGGVMISPKSLTSKDLATHPVGTGAYVLESFQPGQRVAYKRRTDKGGIWDPKTGGPAKVDIVTYPGPDALNNAVKSGQVDIVTWAGDKKPYQSLLDSGHLRTQTLDTVLNMVGLSLNQTVKPYDNVKVRQAINYAIDRDRLIRLLHLSPDEADAACQILPEGFPGHQPDCPYTADAGDGHWHSPDLAKATRLARESGTTHIPVTIWTNAGIANDEVNAYLVGLLRKLGYQATFRSIPDERFMATVSDASRKTQISLGGWIADIPRPSDFFVPVLSCRSYVDHLPGSANLTGFCDPHVDQLVTMAQAAQLTDEGAFRNRWAEIDRLVTGQAPWVPILNFSGSVFVSARAGNYQDSPYYGGSLLDQMWVQ
jgi:ABC-type transport system substrate-binding protein